MASTIDLLGLASRSVTAYPPLPPLHLALSCRWSSNKLTYTALDKRHVSLWDPGREGFDPAAPAFYVFYGFYFYKGDIYEAPDVSDLFYGEPPDVLYDIPTPAFYQDAARTHRCARSSALPGRTMAVLLNDLTPLPPLLGGPWPSS